MLSAEIKTKARALGFCAVGIARADVPLEDDVLRWREHVDGGMHGAMDYVASGERARQRLDGEEVLPGAKSVVCVARRYAQAGEPPEILRGIARYAHGQDYHVFLRKKLRKLATFLRALGGEARPLVDDAPILERAWASRAGLGFVGKNGMLIVPGLGSMAILGEVVTTLSLAPDEPITGKCGSCTLCLEACPTEAFPRPFVLDARRCIAYLTIESREPVPMEMREKMGEHLFGCDDCQTVCPFNRAKDAQMDDAGPFAPLARWKGVELEDLLRLEQDGDAWAKLASGSPIHRATAAGLASSAAIVLGNRKDPAALPALRAAAEHNAHPRVRDAARWAIERISHEEEKKRRNGG